MATILTTLSRADLINTTVAQAQTHWPAMAIRPMSFMADLATTS